MPILGITGGVATGKTTFRRLLLTQLDADFFDADACARELLDHDEMIREQVLEKVSPLAYGLDGHANRTLLREIIYKDMAKKRTLEAILHPAIRGRWAKEATLANKSHRIFVVDIPLLFETKADSLFDRIITVACRRDTQILRMTTQRNLDQALAERIIESQLPLNIKMQNSHHVVWNDTSLPILEMQVDLIAASLSSLFNPC